MRDALEEATRHECDLISDEELAEITSLSIRGDLKPTDFAGLDNLGHLSIADIGSKELRSVLNRLDNLGSLVLQRNPGAPFRITHPNANLQERGRGWER